MSVDVPFETAEQISAKLILFEELFQYRYSERDEGYRQCLQNASRVFNVPVISPWPPRGGGFPRRGRYDDWDGGGRRRGGYRGRRRDYHHPPYHHSHPHNPPRYHDDRPPPWAYGPRSPREDYRDRSPMRPSSPHSHYRRHGSASPHHHPPPSSSHLSPHHHSSHQSPRHSSHLSPHDHAHHRSRSRSHSPAPGRHSHSPRREIHTEGESASEQEAPPPVPPSLTLDLQDQEEKAVPSESDVLDILSSAHASHSQVTAGNLRKVQREGIMSHRSRRDDRDAVRHGRGHAKSTPAVKSREDLPSKKSSGLGMPSLHAASAGSLLVTHGKTEAVSTLLVGDTAVELGEEFEGAGRKAGEVRAKRGGKEIAQKKLKKKKQKRADITQSDEDREGDSSGMERGRSGRGPHSGLGDMASILGSGVVRITPGDSNSEVNVSDLSERDEEGREELVMRLDKRFCHTNPQHSQTEGVMSHSVPNTPSSDLTPTFPPVPVAFSASYPPSSIISPTRRELRVVCSKLPASSIPSVLPQPPSATLVSAEHSSSRESREKKKKKKKKKHKTESEDRDAGELTAPLRFKINLARPPDV